MTEEGREKPSEWRERDELGEERSQRSPPALRLLSRLRPAALEEKLIGETMFS